MTSGAGSKPTLEMRHAVDDKAHRLAKAVSAKIAAETALFEAAKGPIVIKAFPKGTGFDVKITVTT